MKTTGNTILITGGGSGIGRALAEAFHGLGNQIVIAGRSGNKLDETAGVNPGMKSLEVDMTKPESIEKLASRVTADFPKLDAVIHCAGVMIAQDLLKGGDVQSVDQVTIGTNLLGPIRLTEALLPTLRSQPSAAIMTVSSGLAFVPRAMTPAYCATKAAIHSYSQSLRFQLKDTAIQVIELVPPYVATTLMGEAQANDPNAMPLADFISEAMGIIKSEPEANEILVKRVYPLRFAESEGREKYQRFFENFNAAAAAQ